MTTARSALFVMDPFRTVHVHLDTTFAFMREARNRGIAVWACRIGDLGAANAGGFAHAKQVEVIGEPKRPFEILARAKKPLDDFEVVFMRKDPPFDIDYVFATYLLDGTKNLVVNRPSGLRDANEKAFILRFPDAIPATIITRQADDIHDFLEAQGGRCIAKPLDGAGGSGVFLLSDGDPNLSSLIETRTDFGRRYTMCQAYIPEAKLGDKRILLIDGDPVGATLRVPPEGELRGNIHVGAVCERAELTARDLEICAVIGPALRARGLIFVGIDVIGGYLTEINVTSPTGVREVNEFDGVSVEGQLWNWIERH